MRLNISENQHYINRQNILRQSGLKSIQELSYAIKKPYAAISSSFKGINTNHKINSAIASFFGMTMADFFPDLYCIIPDRDSDHDSKVNVINESVNSQIGGNS